GGFIAVVREFVFQIVGDDPNLRQVFASGHAYDEEAHLSTFNEGLLKDIPAAVRTRGRRLKDVIRYARIGACNAIQNPVKRNLCAVGLQCSHDSIMRSALRSVAASMRMTFCFSGVGSKNSQDIARNHSSIPGRKSITAAGAGI